VFGIAVAAPVSLDTGVVGGSRYSGGYVSVPSSVGSLDQLAAHFLSHPVVAAPAFDATFDTVVVTADGQSYNGNWPVNGPNSDWIGAADRGQSDPALAPFVDTAAGFTPVSSAPQGLFYDTTTFDVPAGTHPSLVRGCWSTDNNGVAIFLNGVSQAQANTTQFTALTPFTLAGGDFRTGTNTLTFVDFNEEFGAVHPGSRPAP
jgi:hypothetical protein